MTMSIPQSYKAQLFEGLKDKVIETDIYQRRPRTSRIQNYPLC